MMLRTFALKILLLVAAFNSLAECRMVEFIKPSPRVQLVLESNNEHITNKSQSYSPVIFWHGMGDTAQGSIKLERLALEKKYPGILVYSIQIGNSVVEDEMAGYFSDVNQQVRQVCDLIVSNEQIKKAGQFNAIGFSQGAQFLRALVQRCPFRANGIKVKNLISLGGQHQGVFGLPRCKMQYCEYIKYVLDRWAYVERIQKHFVQAQYWHDPLDELTYKDKNLFLAEVNNERTLNQAYINNLLQLENFVLIKFEHDEMVTPRESSHFEFYEPGQDKRIVPLQSSPLWKEDRLGLKKLNESNRLKLISIPGNHLQYHMSWFMNEIAEKYLKT